MESNIAKVTVTKALFVLIRSMIMWYLIVALASWSVDIGSWGIFARSFWVAFSLLTWAYAVSVLEKKIAEKK